MPSPKAGSTSAQCAREQLVELLSSGRELTHSSQRARIFARLCGVVGQRFSQERVDRVLRVLGGLFAEHSNGAAAASRAALGGGRIPTGSVTVPMEAEGICLSKVLREHEAVMGGKERLDRLIEKIEQISKVGPAVTVQRLQ